MERLFEWLLKGGFQPLRLFPEISELEKTVTRSDVAALLMLHLHHQTTMSELAAKLGLPLSTLTSLSKRLDRKGLIERYRSVKDRRIILIRLTDKGENIAERAQSIIQGIFERIQKALSPDERTQFLTLALKIVQALKENTENGEDEKHASLHKIRIDD